MVSDGTKKTEMQFLRSTWSGSWHPFSKRTSFRSMKMMNLHAKLNPYPLFSTDNDYQLGYIYSMWYSVFLFSLISKKRYVHKHLNKDSF